LWRVGGSKVKAFRSVERSIGHGTNLSRRPQGTKMIMLPMDDGRGGTVVLAATGALTPHAAVTGVVGVQAGATAIT
jgi:hypothetical protein